MGQDLGAVAPFPSLLYDTFEDRTTDAGHAVEGLGGDLVFRDLAAHFPGVQPGADDEFAATDLGFDEGAIIVPRRYLPRHSTMLVDMLYVSVAPIALAKDCEASSGPGINLRLGQTAIGVGPQLDPFRQRFDQAG